MRLHIRQPSWALVLRPLWIAAGMLLGIQICYGEVTWSTYIKQKSTRLAVFYGEMRGATDTELKCCVTCRSEKACNSVSYNPSSKECKLSSVILAEVGSNSDKHDEWVTFSKGECMAPPKADAATVQEALRSAFTGQRANYTCHTDYTPVKIGSATTSSEPVMTVTCQADGTWSNLLFQCTKECMAPPTADAASVHFTGQRATYTCHTGYAPVNIGNATTSSEPVMTVTCQADGTWSDLLFQCTKGCMSHPTADAASVHFTGQRATFTCHTGYTPVNIGNATTSSEPVMTVTCQADGTWSDLMFQCTKECMAPPKADAATVKGARKSAFTSATYTCNHGYAAIKIGSASAPVMTVTCQADGTWSDLLFQCKNAYTVYEGCYGDYFFTGGVQYLHNAIEICVVTCGPYGYQYIGLLKTKCECGREMKWKAKINDAACNINCRGNQKQTCGGKNAWTVHAIHGRD